MRELKFNLSVDTDALLAANPTEWFSKSYLTPSVVDDFRVIPGIKYKTKVATNVFDNVLKAANCSWSATDSVLDAVEMEVKSVDAMVSICQYDLEKSFVSLQMAKNSGNFEVASFMSHYYDELSKEVNAEIQDIRWNGSTSLTGTTYLKEADGYIKKLNASTGVTGVTKVTGAIITSANIVSVLTQTVSALPERVKGKKADIRIYMSASNALKYAIATLGLNNNFNYTGELPLAFAGYKISVQEGMPDSYIVAGNKNNFIYLCDGEGDATAIKTVNLLDTVVEPTLRTRVSLKIGFYLLNENEIAMYKAN